MGVTWSQFFPPGPALTEENVPRQAGRVFLVTGGNSGVGYELCKMLYQAGGTVYLAARSDAKANEAIDRIRSSTQTDGGQLVPLSICLDDLNTIKTAVTQLLSKTERLDVLFNNAGGRQLPGSISVDSIAPLTLARDSLDGRQCTWLNASHIHVLGPSPPADLGVPSTSQQVNYANTKMGNWFLANALQKQAPSVLSVTANPGNLKTALTRHMSFVVPLLAGPLLHPAKFGAYTEFWAGLTEDLTLSEGGKYIVPWGRVHPSPGAEMLAAMKSKEDGGTGVADSFVEFCYNETRQFR